MSSITRDYQRVYEKTSYPSEWRKKLQVWTSPGFQAVAAYRFCHWLLEKRIPVLGLMIQRLIEVWTGISLPAETSIGPGLLIFHFGGVIVNNNAVIGNDVTLHHDVTIGNKVPGGGSPKIGDRVLIGAGAKVLGDITIGDDSEIGANAVVTKSLPKGSVAVGIPARIIRNKLTESRVEE